MQSRCTNISALTRNIYTEIVSLGTGHVRTETDKSADTILSASETFDQRWTCPKPDRCCYTYTRT